MMLKDFAWALSLSCVEVLRFGSRAWWWRLRWAVAQEFKGLDIQALVSKKSASGGQELSYGETPTVTLARILELAELEPGSRFVDLGSGRGVTVMAAGLMGYKAAGLEIVGEYVERSRRAARRLGLEVELRQGDLLCEEWPEGGLYLLNSTAFPEPFREQLWSRLRELPSGVLVVTFDWVLEEFEQTASLRLPVTRGTVMCRVYRV